MQRILIANRGEIARRIQRTCRAMGSETVAVYSDADRETPAAWEADSAVALGGTSAAESYLDIGKIVDAAVKTGCDGIHPGYGFLAENADFARACEAAGVTLIGPPADVIAAMGAKTEAKRRMREADVPVLEQVDVGGTSADELTAACEKLGWPVLVKASAGGGGRGMRIVRNAGELAAAVETAQREAGAAFGDETVFIEPYVEASRHVEIQIFGDTHGNVVSLGERECSIQRRHQKIIEEAPSPAVDDALRQAMGEAAVRGGKAIGYVGAGTVEFLLAEGGKFYFLEVNTRLQVEHPVTECVTGLDLVRLQILVADGEPLPEAAINAKMQGHSIEARLYAEDPARDFMPAVGTLRRFRVPDGEGIRVETGVVDGSEISPFYDPMVAKVVATAATRGEAARKLAQVLRGAEIHGLVTNRELLVRVLEHKEFLAGKTDTHFLTRHDPAGLSTSLAEGEAEGWQAAAGALALQAARRSEAPVLASLPSGWRNNRTYLAETELQVQGSGDERVVKVGYGWRHGKLLLEVDGERIEDAVLEECSAESVRMAIGGVTRTYRVDIEDASTSGAVYVDSSLGASAFEEVERFPLPEDQIAAGSLVAPLPGVVNEVKVSVGDMVSAGASLLVIESMKMLHHVEAPADGKVSEVMVEVGGHVEAGTVLVVVDEAGGE